MSRLIRYVLLSSGGVPAISVSPSNWDFGATPVGTPVTKEFTIENTGTGALEITLPITSPAGFTVTVDPATSVAPGGSTTFTVEADADSVDTFSGNLEIVSNAASSPTLIAVTATVTIITSGLVAWYDASDASTLFEDSAGTTPAADNADVIGRWSDKSGNAYHATQGTTANKPTLRTAVKNGKSIVRFDGSDDFLQKTSYADFGDSYTIFLVAMIQATVDASIGLFEVSTGTADTGFLFFADSSSRFRARGTGLVTSVNSDIRSGNYVIHEMFNSGSLISHVINGGTAATAAYTSPNPNTLNQLDIGRVLTAGYLAPGDFCEMIIYTGNKTENERIAVRNYLNAKWAVY